jgi:hypothetical protein
MEYNVAHQSLLYARVQMVIQSKPSGVKIWRIFAIVNMLKYYYYY